MHKETDARGYLWSVVVWHCRPVQPRLYLTATAQSATGVSPWFYTVFTIGGTYQPSLPRFCLVLYGRSCQGKNQAQKSACHHGIVPQGKAKKRLKSLWRIKRYANRGGFGACPLSDTTWILFPQIIIAWRESYHNCRSHDNYCRLAFTIDKLWLVIRFGSSERCDVFASGWLKNLQN